MPFGLDGMTAEFIRFVNSYLQSFKAVDELSMLSSLGEGDRVKNVGVSGKSYRS